MTRNTSLLLAGRVTSAATTLLVLALISRIRGSEALGLVALGFAVGAIAATISDAGTTTLLVRQAARLPADAARLLGAGLLIRLLTVPVISLTAGALLIFVAPTGWSVGLLVTLGLIAQQAAELTRSVFNAQQRMGVSAAHMIIENLAWLGVVAAALVVGAPLDVVFAAALVTLGASFLAGLLLDRTLGSVRARMPERSWLVAYLREARPFAAFSVLGIAYSRVDTILVGALVSGPAIAAAGAYFATVRVVAVFEYLPDALSRATYPELSRRFQADPATLATVLGPAARVLMWVGIPVPFMMLVVGEPAMVMLFGPDLAGVGPLIAGLSIAVPIRYLGYLYGVTLTSTDAHGRRVLAAAAALAVVVALDLVLIPLVGVGGAVVGAISAASCVLVVYAVEVKRRFGSLGVGRATVLALAASILALIIGWPAAMILGGLAGAAVGGSLFAVIYAAIAAAVVRRPWPPRHEAATIRDEGAS